MSTKLWIWFRQTPGWARGEKFGQVWMQWEGGWAAPGKVCAHWGGTIVWMSNSVCVLEHLNTIHLCWDQVDPIDLGPKCWNNQRENDRDNTSSPMSPCYLWCWRIKKQITIFLFLSCSFLLRRSKKKPLPNWISAVGAAGRSVPTGVRSIWIAQPSQLNVNNRSFITLEFKIKISPIERML